MKHTTQTRISALALAAVSLIFLTACSASVERITSRSIDEFHSQLNDEKYKEIYTQADVNLQHSISEADFTEKLRAVRQKHGNASQNHFPERTMFQELIRGWHFGFANHEEKTTMQVFSNYERGLVVEMFEWAVKDGQAKLVDYKYLGQVFSSKAVSSK